MNPPEWKPVADAPHDGTWFWNLHRIVIVGVNIPATLSYGIRKVRRKRSSPDSNGYWADEYCSIPDTGMNGWFLVCDGHPAPPPSTL